MTDISIPKEALEAAAREICIGMGNNPDDLSCDGSGRVVWMCWEAEACAACLAMLKAWPGMSVEKTHIGVSGNVFSHDIILPLPQESINAEV